MVACTAVALHFRMAMPNGAAMWQDSTPGLTRPDSLLFDQRRTGTLGHLLAVSVQAETILAMTPFFGQSVTLQVLRQPFLSLKQLVTMPTMNSLLGGHFKV